MILAETLSDPNGFQSIGWLVVGIAAIIAILNQGKDLLDKFTGKDKTTNIAQPLAVAIQEELHEQFASKKAFDELARHNTDRHAQIFARIDRVEREGRDNLDRRIAEINADRARTMEKVNDQLTVIREAVVEIRTKQDIG